MSKQVLVGLTGPAGSGKDAVAGFMTGYYRYGLADPIKLGIETMFDLPSTIWERSQKEVVIPWLGKSPRQLAQTLGTEWGRSHVDPDLWLKLMLRTWDRVRVGGNPLMVVADVRFDNEAAAIITAGGTIWKVEREGVAPVAQHVSEKGVKSAYIKGVVKNNKGLVELRYTVAEWRKLLMERYSK